MLASGQERRRIYQMDLSIPFRTFFEPFGPKGAGENPRTAQEAAAWSKAKWGVIAAGDGDLTQVTVTAEQARTMTAADRFRLARERKAELAKKDGGKDGRRDRA